MRFIGRVADGSTESFARVILLKDLEREIFAEKLVLIRNGGDENPMNEILGVLRGGLGKNEFLNHTSYRPDVAYMRYGGEPSGAREVYSFIVKPIGMITENGLEPNLAIIQPRSPVYLLEEEDNPLRLMAKENEVIWTCAYVEGYKSWKIPVKKFFIPYHVGIYGSTGSGKSWFTRFILIPLYVKAGYKVLVLDWSGTDYAPYFREFGSSERVSITDIALDEESVLAYLENKTSNFGGNDNVRDAFDSFIEKWSNKVNQALSLAISEGKNPEQILYEQMKNFVDQRIKSISRGDWRESAERASRRVFRRFKPEDLKPIMGLLTIEDIMRKFREKDLVIVDMSGALSEAKLGFFLSLSKHFYGMMEAGKELNIALVIDEAPQYAPWEPKGLQRDTTEMIKNLAALGRKRMLNLTLIAQGIRGEIGINAAVRRNLNTHFFGRIHPLDASGEGGALEWLSPYGITADQMLQLKQGRFYFTGVMSPSPVPLLITYEPPESGRGG